jgi:hypothetical protein
MGDARTQHETWHRAHDQELLALRQQVLALHTEVRSLEDELGRARARPSASYDGLRRDPRPRTAVPAVDASRHGDPGERLGG